MISYSNSGKNESESSVSFDELLEYSDVISLHCPLNEKTLHLFDYDAICRMKDSAILINVARGKVVDNADLARALDEGRIAAAGLDVIEEEPLSKDNPLMKVRDKDRLIITPHMAWASTEARGRCVAECAENIASFLNGEDRCRVV